jgi:hypothetical protein
MEKDRSAVISNQITVSASSLPDKSESIDRLAPLKAAESNLPAELKKKDNALNLARTLLESLQAKKDRKALQNMIRQLFLKHSLISNRSSLKPF